MAPRGTAQHVTALDGARGMAIALVMLYHGWTYTGHGDIGHAIDQARSIGWAGVDLFFVLSGFLITGILLQSRDDPHYWRNFLIRRGLRIFPLYYAVLSAMLVGGLVLNRLGLSNVDPSFLVLDNIWINFLYLTNFAIASIGENHVPLDIAWSLAIEEQFYLLYPALVRRLRPQTLVRVLVVVVIAAPILRWLTWEFGAQPKLGPYVLPYCRMDALAAGALLRMARELGRDRIVAMVARLAPLLCALGLVILYAWPRKDVRFIIIGYSTTSLAAAGLIARLLESSPSAWLRGLFENRTLVFLGKISYGLYLFHLFARAAVTLVLAKIFDGKHTDEAWFCAAQLVGMIGVTVAASSVSFYYFERPVLRFKERLAPSTPAR
jgi:peptidoglycan/LPS O-acetylase OafA/YrhL